MGGVQKKNKGPTFLLWVWLLLQTSSQKQWEIIPLNNKKLLENKYWNLHSSAEEIKWLPQQSCNAATGFWTKSTPTDSVREIMFYCDLFQIKGLKKKKKTNKTWSIITWGSISLTVLQLKHTRKLLIHFIRNTAWDLSAALRHCHQKLKKKKN